MQVVGWAAQLAHVTTVAFLCFPVAAVLHLRRF